MGLAPLAGNSNISLESIADRPQPRFLSPATDALRTNCSAGRARALRTAVNVAERSEPRREAMPQNMGCAPQPLRCVSGVHHAAAG